MNVAFTHTKRSLASKEIVPLVVSGQSLLTRIYTPLERPGDHDDQKGEVDARVLAPLYSGTDRRFRQWEDVVLDSFARGSEVLVWGCRAPLPNVLVSFLKYFVTVRA